MATNYFTQVEYKGQNAVDLNGLKHEDNQWATYKQWLEGGYQVQKGEHGQGILALFDEDEKGERKAKFYRVFNISQVKEITDEERKELKKGDK